MIANCKNIIIIIITAKKKRPKNYYYYDYYYYYYYYYIRHLAAKLALVLGYLPDQTPCGWGGKA
jgi:hypothetical protein